MMRGFCPSLSSCSYRAQACPKLEESSRLDAQLSKLVIEVSSPPPDLEVKRDGGKTVRLQVQQELPAAAIVAPAPTGPSSITESASTTTTSASTAVLAQLPPPQWGVSWS